MAKVIVSDADGEREVALSGDRMSIGRVAKGNDIVIKVAEASRQHCALIKEGKVWFIEDAKSSNGTRVNGRKVTKFELQDGDEITVGVASLRFLDSDVVALSAEPELELDDDLDLEISLDEPGSIRFLNTDREDEKIEIHSRLTIGRRSNSDLELTVKGVSGTHAEIVNEGGEWLLRDLGSTNGTMLEGEKVAEARLEPGLRVGVGIAQFVFGIGQDEGDGVVLDLAEAPVSEAGGEVFAISEKNYKKKQKAALLIWLVLVAAAGVGIWYWLTQESGGAGSIVKVQSRPGNMLGPASSFEPQDEAEITDLFETDSDALDFGESQRFRHSGLQSLEVEANGGPGVHEIYYVAGLGSVAAAEQIEIGGFFRTAGLDGLCGLGLAWFDRNDRRLGASYINAALDSSDFTEIRGVLTAPEGCAKAGFVLTATDAQGRFQVDDIFAVRRRGDGREVLAIAGFELQLDAAGQLGVSRDSAEVAVSGSFARLDRGNEGSGRLLLLAALAVLESREASGNAVTTTGYLRLDGSLFAIEQKLSLSDGGFQYECSSAAGKTAASPTHFAWEVPVDEGLVAVTEGLALRKNDDFRQERVSSLVIGNGARAMRVEFEGTSTVAMSTLQGRSYLLFPLKNADGSKSLSFKAQLDFSGEREEVTRLYDAAERADLVEKRYGQAIIGYRDIVDRFSYRKDLALRAEARHTALRQQGEDLAQDLAAKANSIKFFGTYAYDYDAFVGKSAAEVGRWEGSEVATRIQATTDDLGKSWSERRTQEKASTARVHLARGNDLMTEGRSLPVLARGFFLSVIALVPDSEEGHEAQAQLKKIKTLLGR
ncbi:MAG: FHA domain-containing protein [Planctomycetota bacterium]